MCPGDMPTIRTATGPVHRNTAGILCSPHDRNDVAERGRTLTHTHRMKTRRPQARNPAAAAIRPRGYGEAGKSEDTHYNRCFKWISNGIIVVGGGGGGVCRRVLC